MQQQAAPSAPEVAVVQQQPDDPFLMDSCSNSSDAELSDDFRQENRKRRNRGGARRPRSKESESPRSNGSNQSRQSYERYRRSPTSDHEKDDGDNRRKRRREEERSRSREHKPREPREYRSDQRQGDERDQNYRNSSGHHYQQKGGRQRLRNENDGAYNEEKIWIPRLSKPLVSQQHFLQLQSKHVPNHQKEYDNYKQLHKEQHQKDFLLENEHSSWFREKYDPTYRYLRWKHVVQNARNVSQHEDYADPNHLSVCIKGVPAWVHINLIQDATNCTQIYFSEPLKMSDFERICWLKFGSQQDYDDALKKTFTIQGEREPGSRSDSFPARPVKTNLLVKGQKQMPALAQDADERDLALAIKIVELLDSEYQTSVNLTGFTKTWDKLAFLVKYMWKVFGYAFYSGVKSEDERTCSIKCFQYERNPNYVQELDEEATQFEQKYLAFAQLILAQGAQPVSDPKDDPLLTEKLQQYCLKNCIEEKAEKFKCNICQKSFCGEEFVIKHINNKHAAEIEKEIYQRYFRRLARNAYIADKDKIEGAPIAHSFSSYALQGNKRREHRPRNQDPNAPQHPNSHLDGQASTSGAAGEQVEKKDYVDYDDPMTSKQLQMKRQIANASSAAAGSGLKEKSQINYDDLF